MYRYQVGDRVVLVYVSGGMTVAVEPGTEGTVMSNQVGRRGIIEVTWDDTSTMNIIPNSGDVIVPIDKPLNSADAKEIIHELHRRDLPKYYELAVKGYGALSEDDEEAYVGTPTEEYEDVLKTYDTFMFWRS